MRDRGTMQRRNPWSAVAHEMRSLYVGLGV